MKKREYPKESNLVKIKSATKLLYDVVPLNIRFSILLNHPMLSSITQVISKEFVESVKDNILNNKYITITDGYIKFSEEDFNNLQDFGGIDSEGNIKETNQYLLDLRNPLDELLCKLYFHKLIDGAKDIISIYIYVRNPYKLLWFDLVNNYLSEKDFAHYIEDCWISEENPNQDVNVTKKQSLSWFKQATKTLLMNEEDYAHWQNLPNEVHIWRGVSIGREPYGLSWTDDYDKALWFKNRFNKKGDNGEVIEQGYLLEAIVPKDLIIAYFNTRSEAECLLDVFKAKRLGLIKKVE